MGDLLFENFQDVNIISYYEINIVLFVNFIWMLPMQNLRLGRHGDGRLATFKQSFAAGLARALKDLGLSQQKVAAKALGVSEPTLSKWLAGEKTPQNDETWERIKKVTGLSFGELLPDPDAPQDPFVQFLKREAAIRGFQLVKSSKKSN